MRVFENSITLHWCRRLWAGSLIVRSVGATGGLLARISLGSRVLGVFRVGDYLSADRDILLGLADGSGAWKGLVVIGRRSIRPIEAAWRADREAFHRSFLYVWWNSLRRETTARSSMAFLFLFCGFFFLFREALLFISPPADVSEPWTAGLLIGALAAYLLARLSGRSPGRGLVGGVVAVPVAGFRYGRHLFKSVRYRVGRLIYGRQEPPVEGGPGA